MATSAQSARKPTAAAPSHLLCRRAWAAPEQLAAIFSVPLKGNTGVPIRELHGFYRAWGLGPAAIGQGV